MIDAPKTISEELIKKNHFLHTALEQANRIIYILEKENMRLKKILDNSTEETQKIS